MPLILAIDPDKRQSTQLASLVKAQLQAELVQRATAGEALEALQGRVPDLVLTTSLISPREDAVLATYLRELGPAGAHVQTVTIPLLGTAAPQRARGVLAALRREKPQPAMIDGCAPDVFAEQIRQYLATAEEQKAIAVAVASGPTVDASGDAVETYEASPFETVATAEEFAGEPMPAVADTDDAFAEAVVTEPAVTEPYFAEPAFAEPVFAEPSEAPAPVEAAFVAAPVDDEPVAEPFIEPAVIESHVEQWASPVPETILTEAPVLEEPAPVDTVAVAEAFDADAEALMSEEPAALPLSQLLRLVSDWTSPAATAQPKAETPSEEALFDAPLVDAPAVEELVVEAPAVEASVDEAPFVEIPVVAPRAIEDARFVDAAAEEVEDATVDESVIEESIANAMTEPPPVDPVAAQALDELSRLTPAASIADGVPLEPPVPVVEMRSFQSLDSIANELAAAPPAKYDNLDDIASLLAASPAPGRSTSPGFESLFATPPAAAPARPIDVPGIDPSLFAAPPARHTAHEPSSFESLFVPQAPVEPTVFAAQSEIESALTELEEAPAGAFFIEPVVEPVAATPMAEAPVAAEPIFIEPNVEEPAFTAPLAIEAEFEASPVAETYEAIAAEPTAAEPLVAEPLVAEPVFAAPVAPVAKAQVAASVLDEEISLDIDTFEAPPKVEERFAFTLVDGFGDAWSDFELPTAEAAAADFGLSAQPPMDPFATAAEPGSAPVKLDAPAGDAAAPILDDEALSLIGDAARKASLDALVIEEFERGSRRTPRKPKAKKAHAGATHAAAVPDRTVKKKGPVQDEWGLFDPEQCGFAALEDEESGDHRPARDGNTRVRVISY